MRITCSIKEEKGRTMKRCKTSDLHVTMVTVTGDVEKTPFEKLRLGTYSHHPFRKEDDLIQTSMIMFHVNTLNVAQVMNRCWKNSLIIVFVGTFKFL